MSWSLSTPIVPASELEAEVNGLEIPDYFGKDDEQQAMKAAMVEQLEAAKVAVVGLFRSGSVGDDTYYYKVSMSGHANPHHQTKPGWSNDFVTISISQMDVRPAVSDN